MKLVKSDWRSKLKSETLSDLLTVQLSSQSIKEFDPTPAIELWHLDSVHPPWTGQKTAGLRTTLLSHSEKHVYFFTSSYVFIHLDVQVMHM